MIFIGKQSAQFIDADKRHVRSLYDTLRERLGGVLSADTWDDWALDMQYHEEIHLQDLAADDFRLVGQLLFAPDLNPDPFLAAILPELKAAFEIDPRFQQ